MQQETASEAEPVDYQQELIGKLIVAWETVVQRQTMHTEGWSMLSPYIYELRELHNAEL